jgi:hypothetical protein
MTGTGIEAARSSGLSLRPGSGKCFGVFCTAPQFFAQGLRASMTPGVKPPSPPTLLYHYIADYSNDYEHYK